MYFSFDTVTPRALIYQDKLSLSLSLSTPVEDLSYTRRKELRSPFSPQNVQFPSERSDLRGEFLQQKSAEGLIPLRMPLFGGRIDPSSSWSMQSVLIRKICLPIKFLIAFQKQKLIWVKF